MHRRLFSRLAYSKLGFVRNELEGLQALEPISPHRDRALDPGRERPAAVEISHPWPEWVDLMERLLFKSYLNRTAFSCSSSSSSLDSNRIRTACLNFARDRPNLIRYFSRRDIKIIVGSGCPSLDRKVVNSGKRLRAHVGIDEGNVCSSCNLRGNCERAYVKPRDDESGRTVDVMRILLTYGLDITIKPVENMACLEKKIRDSSRKLLSEMVEFSGRELDSGASKMASDRPFTGPERLSAHPTPKGHTSVPLKQGDWICPKCNFLNFAKNIKCLRCDGLFQERLRKLHEDSEYLPLKKGDWICGKCNFLNFAKNTKCLQCHEKPQNRNLNPGDWECPSCNYVNFGRNMYCLRCDWKRPKAAINDKSVSPSQDDDNRQHYRISFVRNNDDTNQHVTQKFPTLEDEKGLWSSEEESSSHGSGDDDDDHHMGGSKKFVEFNDFPIAGGKGAVSKSLLLRNKWKEEMLKRSQGQGKTEEKDERPDFTSCGAVEELNESDDDDDIGGWFRCRSESSDKR